MKHRFLSGLLAAAMVLTMLPTAAFAQGEVDPAAAPAQVEQPATPESATPAPDVQPTPAPAAPDAAAAVQALQEKINALPTAEEIAAYGDDEKTSLADAIEEIDTAMEGLTAAERAALDMAAYDAAIAALYSPGFTAEEQALMQAEPADLSLVDQLRQRELLAANNAALGIDTLALGDNSDPYLISNTAQLAELATLVKNGNVDFTGASYKLVQDIDLAGVCGAGKGNWVPIGDDVSRNCFTGTFDGNKHTISNLYINDDHAGQQGLFGRVEGGTIKNLGVVNAYINVSSHAGAVVGEAYETTVESCYSTGTVTSGAYYAGGVVGGAYNTTLKNCYSTATVTSHDGAGGVVGHAMMRTNLQNCYSTGAVSGSKWLGGVVGWIDIDSITVQNCVALNPSVSGSSSSAEIGAVMGVDDGVGSTFADCYYWGGMTVKNGSGDVTKDTTNSTALTCNSATGTLQYTPAGGTATDFAWADAGFGDATVWDTTGTLPVLAGFAAAQTSTLPLYITGTGATILEISDAAGLLAFANAVNKGETFEGKIVNLVGDIDLSTVCGPTKGSWTPIGQYDDCTFRGKFDGQGHTISGLYMNSLAPAQGLFGNTENATIQNVGVVNINITTVNIDELDTNNPKVGGVVGAMDGGALQNCYTTGTITAKAGGTIAGGVVGYCSSISTGGTTGTVRNCYSAVNLSDEGTLSEGTIAGGVAGEVYYNSNLHHCYSTGMVMANSAYSTAGGIVGRLDGAATLITECVALNPSVSGVSSVGAVVGLLGSIAEDNAYWGGMPVTKDGTELESAKKDTTGATVLTYNTDTSTLQNAIARTDYNWSTFTSGWVNNGAGALPTLAGFTAAQTSTLPGYITASTDTLCIYTAADLLDFADHVNGTGKYADVGGGIPGSETFEGKTILLMDNIDLSTVCSAALGNWAPIGTSVVSFYGTFDGQGHTITNLYINDTAAGPDATPQGLFGYIRGSAVVKNLGVTNANITAAKYIGGVVGCMYGGTIQNCYTTGTLTANEEDAGGVVGGMDGGTVTNCYSSAAVKTDGDGYGAGGVVGYLYDGTTKNCYSTGTVTGTVATAKAGGVVGRMQQGDIMRCYSTATVTGGQAGGIVGAMFGSGRLNYSVALGAVAGSSAAGALVGSVADHDASNNNYYLNTMPVTLNGVAQTAAAALSTNILSVLNGILREDTTTNRFPWDTFTGTEGWVVPGDALALPYFTGSGDRPTLALASTQAFALEIDYVNEYLTGVVVGKTYNVTYTVDGVQKNDTGTATRSSYAQTGAIAIKEAWFGQTLTITRGDASQTVYIKPRPAAELVTPVELASVTETQIEFVEVPGQEYNCRTSTESNYLGSWDSWSNSFPVIYQDVSYYVATRIAAVEGSSFASTFSEIGPIAIPSKVTYQDVTKDPAEVEQLAYPLHLYATANSNAVLHGDDYTGGWYYVRNRNSCSYNSLTVQGDVKLILSSSNQLRIVGNITIEEGGRLTIYYSDQGQSSYGIALEILGSIQGAGAVTFNGGIVTVDGGIAAGNVNFNGNAVVVGTLDAAGSVTYTSGIAVDDNIYTSTDAKAYGSLTLTQAMVDFFGLEQRNRKLLVLKNTLLTIPTGVDTKDLVIQYEVPNYDENGFGDGTQFVDTDPGYTTLPPAYVFEYEPAAQDGNGVYQIEKAGNMYWFAQFVGEEKVESYLQTYPNNKANAILVGDIDLQAGIAAGADKRQWAMIAGYYEGTFDGNGHTLQNLYINTESDADTALFRMIADDGTVKNLTVTGEVTSNGNNSGICDTNDNGTIQNCTSYVKLAGGGYAGGICVSNEFGLIENCFVDADITAVFMGGICGTNSGTIKNCLSVAKLGYGGIAGGGIVVSGHDAVNSYYLENLAENIVLNDRESSIKVTAEQLARGEVAYKLNGSTAPAATSAWRQNLTATTADATPVLATAHALVYRYTDCRATAENGETYAYYTNDSSKQGAVVHNYDAHGVCTYDNTHYQPAAKGTGTESSTYQITNAGNLAWFAALVNYTEGDAAQEGITEANASADAKLTQDIDLKYVCENLNRSWTPIGKDSLNYYTGTFDGNGYEVYNLYIGFDSSASYKGLFGVSAGTIQALGVAGNAHGRKGDNIGGICGQNTAGTITNCYNKATVEGGFGTGGICGYNESKITNCYNVGSIDEAGSSRYAGGICGRDFSGTFGSVVGETISGITNCYSSSPVVGSSLFTLKNCEVLTDEQFTGGYAAYLLNGSTSGTGSIWRQDLSTTNTYPRPNGSRGKIVYAHTTFSVTGTAGAETVDYLNSNETAVIDDVQLDRNTPSTVTLKTLAADGMGTVYYGKKVGDTIAWQLSNVFEGLAAATQYTFYARCTGNAAYAASVQKEAKASTAAAAYTITIPSTVKADGGADADGRDTKFAVTAADLNLGAGAGVTVSLTGDKLTPDEVNGAALTLTHTGTTDTLTSALMQDVAGVKTPVTKTEPLVTFTEDGAYTGYYFTTPATAAATPAGEYTAILTFTVEYKPNSAS